MTKIDVFEFDPKEHADEIFNVLKALPSDIKLALAILSHIRQVTLRTHNLHMTTASMKDFKEGDVEK